jgi:3-oxoacyl-[acyl-carrier-protein] synthase-3
VADEEQTLLVKDFVINRHGRLVFPSNAWPRLDFSVFNTVGQLSAAVSRDFEAKAPSASQIVSRLEAGAYPSRYEFLRDLGLHAFWVNRFAITMYDKRPTRWRDVPRNSDDVFLPLLTPWPGFERSSSTIQTAYQALLPSWDEEAEQKIFEILFAVFAHLRHDAAELPAIKPTVAEFLAGARNHTFVVSAYEPDWPVFSRDEIINAEAGVPELEALLRWAMVLHNQYPWAGSTTRIAAGDEIGDDDFVVLFYPRDNEVADFIQRVRAGAGAGPLQQVAPAHRAAPPPMAHPVADYRPVEVRKKFAIMPRLESLAGVTGEYVCTNEDLIRNASWNWSPMTAAEITAKTGIGQRTYTQRALEELAADAARAALDKAGRTPAQIGAVLCCTCTSLRLIPSVATWLSAELGIFQTHASADLIAACSGLPYGLLEAIRILQEIERPILVVCAEKFSDKLGNVRTSRMLFGDGAAAMVIGPAESGSDPDVEVVQTFASGPASEVSAVIWPNPQFDNNLTVYGPAVKAFVKRYLAQMIGELRQLPAPPGLPGSLLDAIDVVVPHQANRVMVEQAAAEAGLSLDRLYFNVGRVGNVSAASIPLAIRDAVADGVISSPVRAFTPAFGAGATAGYAVMRVDPAVVSLAQPPAPGPSGAATPARAGGTTEDIRTGFGE